MGDDLRSSHSEGEMQMDLRKLPPIRVHFRSFSAGGQLDGEGTVRDLSAEGCQIDSDTRVQSVTGLELWFFLPDHDRPIRVHLAELRWTRGRVFGLEFLSMRAEDRERLGRVLQDQAFGPRA